MTETENLPLLLLMGDATCENRAVIEAGMETQWRIEEWRRDDPEEKLAALMAEAHAIVPGGDTLMSGALFRTIGQAVKLKFMQVPFTGVEWLDLSGMPEGCLVSNAYGHEIAMAEFVIGAMLQMEKDICAINASFKSGSWKHRAVGVNDFGQGELCGKTLGIVGFGSIGSEITKRAKAFDMEVIAVSRSPRECPDSLEWYGTMEELPKLLEESDYVVLACALNDETRDLLGAEQFELMRDDAVLVNIARGPVATEEALFNALKDKQIGGAILDVWYKYPKGNPPNPDTGGGMPSNFDFGSLENVIMSPHCSGNTQATDVRRYLGIATNLDLIANGEEPGNQVGVGTAPRA